MSTSERELLGIQFHPVAVTVLVLSLLFISLPFCETGVELPQLFHTVSIVLAKNLSCAKTAYSSYAQTSVKSSLNSPIAELRGFWVGFCVPYQVSCSEHLL